VPEALASLTPEVEMAEDCRRYLREFFRHSWRVLEPATPLVEGKHIDAICDHVQAVLEEWLAARKASRSHPWQNLLINVPPGTAKSRIVSVAAPAWMWLRCPDWRVICVSGNPRVALRDSLFCRQLIESEWYQRTFAPLWKARLTAVDDGEEDGEEMGPLLDWRMAKDQNAKSLFKNTMGGSRLALAIGAKITGDRADCLTGDSLVSTECGPVRIEQLCAMENPPRVWSFNHATGQSELRRIVATRRLVSEKSIVRIESDNGWSLECTSDHRIWTERGYQRAGEIAPGERLRALRVWSRVAGEGGKALPAVLDRLPDEADHLHLWGVREDVSAARLSGTQSGIGGSQGGVLLPSMHAGEEQPVAQGAGLLLSDLRKGDAWLKRSEVLLRGVHSEEGASGQGLRQVQTFIPPAEQPKHLLRSGVRIGCARGPHDRAGQLQVLPRQELRPVFQDDATAGVGAGRMDVLGVLRAGSDADYQHRSGAVDPVGPPHQRGPEGQQAGEPDLRVPALPQEPPQLEPVTVLVVRRGGGEAHVVYDIQVEGNHNFFAGSVLVHNCLLFDDPNDVQRSGSGAELEKVIEAWKGIRNRLNDMRLGVRVAVQQRVDERDFSGYALAAGGWEHLCLPVTYEAGKACRCQSCQRGQTAIGFRDWRAEEGSDPNLCPERFTPEVLAAEQKELGSAGYSAQYQQNPVPADGEIYKAGWWRFWRRAWEPEPLEDELRARTVVLPEKFDDQWISVDCAFKGKESSDPVASGRWGFVGPNNYLLDLEWRQMGFNETLDTLRRQYHDTAWTRPSAVLIEDKANGPAVVETLKTEIQGVIEVNPEGGKEARMRATAPQVESGCVFLPLYAEWRDKYIAEHSAAPNGKHDDAIDQETQALLRRKTVKPPPKLVFGFSGRR